LLLATNESMAVRQQARQYCGSALDFRNLDDVRPLQRRPSPRICTLASGPVVTVGTPVEQEHERSFNVCQSSFGDCSTLPIDSAR